MKVDQYYPPNAIRTYTGKVFDLNNVTPEMICIEDIAHALSYTARFGGHSEAFISVAQHSLRVMAHVPSEFKLAALLHDASEAYIGDMPKPFKDLLPDFKRKEDEIMKVVAGKYGFDYPLNPAIKEADYYMLSWEWNCLIIEDISRSSLMSPEEAKKRFLHEFKKLTE